MEATWTITLCEYEIATGGITLANWRCSAVDGEETATIYGTVGFTPDASSAEFKPYDQVVESDVLAWVWEAIPKAETEANLALQIDQQRNPVLASGLPWVAD